MREHRLLVKDRPISRGHSREHKGSIIPDELWGTDTTATYTREGQATIFFVIDHYTAECLGIYYSGYVKEPETNGYAERFVKTLKEQLLWDSTLWHGRRAQPSSSGVQGELQQELDHPEARLYHTC